jgi:hypothetical protein
VSRFCCNTSHALSHPSTLDHSGSAALRAAFKGDVGPGCVIGVQRVARRPLAPAALHIGWDDVDAGDLARVVPVVLDDVWVVLSKMWGLRWYFWRSPWPLPASASSEISGVLGGLGAAQEGHVEHDRYGTRQAICWSAHHSSEPTASPRLYMWVHVSVLCADGAVPGGSSVMEWVAEGRPTRCIRVDKGKQDDGAVEEYAV